MEVREALRAWAHRSGCRLLVLFGSGVGQVPSVKGDLDLAVDFEPLPAAERRLEIIRELDRLAEPRSADVVFLHERTDPVLRFEVFRGGDPLFERQPGIFVHEKVRALMLYEDAIPFRRARREMLRRVSAERPSVS